MNRRHFLSTTVAASLVAPMHAAPSEARLRVAVIGHTGRGNYGHGLDTMWLKIPEVELVAVADADAKGLAAAQQKLKLDKGFADYHEMLTQTKPDIVAIGPRHPDQHRDMVLAAVAAGARGIYMEKPFCRTPAEADEIAAACETKKVKLSAAHRNRFHPVLPVVASLIKEGLIGQALEIRCRGKEDTRGGALDLWVLGGHVLNLACYFAGKPLFCSATLLQQGRPVTKTDVHEGDEGVGLLAGNEVHARYEMDSGLPVFFDSVQNAGQREAGFGLQIIGTKGILDFRIDTEPLAQVMIGSPFKPVSESRLWQPISTAGVGKPESIAGLGAQVAGHLTAAYDLLTALRENRQPLCNVDEARTTVEMISAVFESHRLNGQHVKMPLEIRDNPLGRL